MRKWILGALAALLVLTAGLALAVVNLDRFVNENRDAIAAQAAERLGREISFGEVGLSFSGGLGVRVADLRVGDDPAFSKEDFVSAEAVDVRVRILPALFGRIEVDRVVLRGPSITVIRTRQGLSTDGLAGGGEETPRGEPAPARAFLVGLVDVAEGKLRYVDRTTRPTGEWVVSSLDFSASDIRPDAPVRFEMSAAVLGASAQNLRAEGRVGPLAQEDLPLEVELALAPVALERALAQPLLAGALPPELAGEGPVRIEAAARGTLADLAFELELGADDAALRYGESFAKPAGSTLELAASGRQARALSAKARLRSSEGSLGGAAYRDLDIDLRMEGDRAVVESLRFAAWEGQLTGSGTADLADSRRPIFDLKARVEKARVEQLLTTVLGLDTVPITGRLSTALARRGAGDSWEAIRPNLTGDGSLELSEGVVKGINPLAGALRALTQAPQLSNLAISRFVSAHPKLLSLEDTPFSELAGRLEIREGWLQLRQLQLAAQQFGLTGAGRVSLDQQLDLETLLRLSESLSNELIETEGRLRFLRDSEGRVGLPLALRGRAPRVAVVPDLDVIARAASQQLVGEALRRVLERKSSRNEAPPAETASGEAAAPATAPAETAASGAETAEDREAAPAPERAPEPARPEQLGRELLERGLGGILGRPEPAPETQPPPADKEEP